MLLKNTQYRTKLLPILRSQWQDDSCSSYNTQLHNAKLCNQLRLNMPIISLILGKDIETGARHKKKKSLENYVAIRLYNIYLNTKTQKERNSKKGYLSLEDYAHLWDTYRKNGCWDESRIFITFSTTNVHVFQDFFVRLEGSEFPYNIDN